jgi:hypothetical protein
LPHAFRDGLVLVGEAIGRAHRLRRSLQQFGTFWKRLVAACLRPDHHASGEEHPGG